MITSLAPDAIQMFVYRAGLALTLAIAFREVMQVFALPCAWYLHGLGRIPGIITLAKPIPRTLLGTAFYGSLLAFVLKVAPLLVTAIMATSFMITVSLYLSTDHAGYTVQDEKGNFEWHVFHHLHLAGLCVLGALVGEFIAAFMHVQRGQLTTYDEGDAFVLHIIWACIGAHYFISAVTKLSKHGLHWPDRRLFPFYIALMRSFRLGDTGRDTQQRSAILLLTRPYIGVALLWAALLCELGGIVYPFSSLLRATIGAALIGLHFFSRILLNISFRENLILLVTFSFDHIDYYTRIAAQFVR